MTNDSDSLGAPAAMSRRDDADESAPERAAPDRAAPSDVSDLMIDTLRSEAAEAGDLDVVALCDRALRGDGIARAKCAARLLRFVEELEGRGSD